MPLLIASVTLVMGYTLLYKGVRDFSGQPMSFKEALTGKA